MIKIIARNYLILGLRRDGGVYSVGSAYLMGGHFAEALSGWSNICDLASSGQHAVGLREDGIVLATGSFALGQCDVWDW